MTNYYGVESTNDVQYDKQGLPVGLHKVMCKSEEPFKDSGFVAEYEIVEGEHKGKSGKTWYLTTHENATTANIARQNLKRIADATGKPVSPSSLIKGRVMKVEVREQKNDSSRTEIFKYHPVDYQPAESYDIPA
jgi:delta-aminolevulinic acid dehydratase/porphobilinogen synthase